MGVDLLYGEFALRGFQEGFKADGAGFIGGEVDDEGFVGGAGEIFTRIVDAVSRVFCFCDGGLQVEFAAVVAGVGMFELEVEVAEGLVFGFVFGEWWGRLVLDLVVAGGGEMEGLVDGCAFGIEDEGGLVAFEAGEAAFVVVVEDLYG